MNRRVTMAAFALSLLITPLFAAPGDLTDLVQKGAWFAVGVLTNKYLAVPLDLIITVHTIAARTKK